jgi:hypothetical protein
MLDSLALKVTKCLHRYDASATSVLFREVVHWWLLAILVVIFGIDLAIAIILNVINIFFLYLFLNFIIVFAVRLLHLVLVLLIVVLVVWIVVIYWLNLLVTMLLLDISHHVEVLVIFISSSCVWWLSIFLNVILSFKSESSGSASRSLESSLLHLLESFFLRNFVI